MSEEETPVHIHIDNSLRTQRILDYLEEQWQRPFAPSATTLRQITELVVSLPEKHRTAGLTAIADHFANNLILHFLHIIAEFRQKAEQEGMDRREREEYLSYIITEQFPKLVGINRIVSIQSLDSLAALSNITLSLQGLSHSDTAGEAQNWMYELPIEYPDELVKEHFIANQSAEIES